jgi:4-diphosphocytidyl-2-C-methyl-D-erythritol kinase
MIRWTAARVLAPAKINLGLEILGRRPDGFHEIRSVLAMVDLADEIYIALAPGRSQPRLQGVPGVAVDDNLITRAVTLFARFTDTARGYDIRVAKRIPAASGLGGASADAAATLLALNDMHGRPANFDQLHALATTLGSDVPFFLGSPSGHVLIATPRIALEDKTARLYGKLAPEDFSDGSTIDKLTAAIINGDPIDPTCLGNAFKRPLHALVPSTTTLVEQMRLAGCTHVALSGAGPAHYALFHDRASAEWVASTLHSGVGSEVEVHVVSFRALPLAVEPA